MVYRMFFLGLNFVSGLMCTVKWKKPKNVLKKPTFCRRRQLVIAISRWH